MKRLYLVSQIQKTLKTQSKLFETEEENGRSLLIKKRQIILRC